MKKYCIFLCLFIILLLCGCSEDSDESKSANGYCPFQLEGKTLLLRNNDATIKLSAEHFKSGVVVNNVTVDYEKYPPSYSYVITNKCYLTLFCPCIITFVRNSIIFSCTTNP